MPGEPSFRIGDDTLRLITEGPERLTALLDLIAGAAKSLRILYYIYVDDDAGAKVRAALIAAALRGVDVKLIVDGMGSEHAANHRFFDPLKEAGVDVCRFVPRWGRRYLLRNHQKLALADESRVIIGGFNILAHLGPGSAAAIGGTNLVLGYSGGSGAHTVGVTGLSENELNALAFGVLVPMFGICVNGVWAALHGSYGPRVAPKVSSRDGGID